MSEIQEKFSGKAAADREDVRAADPEEGVTSYQVAHAWEESQAEGDREGEADESTLR
ncbi:hypothetical protein KCMC57_up59350 [Kitasatospora sp. CMC57]|uniref:Uncharacterized protein n=1 Tax=Kitasatospora sp. CMC57 TaxID=3231513 RepID=A0AB33KAQ5_9ACTN